MNFKAFVAIAALAFGSSAFAGNTGMEQGAKEKGGMEHSGMEQGGVQSEEQMQDKTREPAAADKQAQKMSPKEVCQKLTQMQEGTKKQEQQANIGQWVLGEKGGQELVDRQALETTIGKADCTRETIAGDHAFVVSKTQDKERLIPFVRDGGIWKFDLQAYKTFYRMERMPASK